MTKKRKFLNALVICLLAVGVLAVYPLTKVAVCFNPFDAGGCIAVVYDKAAMRAADRVVLCDGEDRYEITDNNATDAIMIDWITDDLLVASHTALRHVKTDRWLEIYSGDTLVRRMNWASCADEAGVFIYEEDSVHQVYHAYPSDGSDYGMIFPSESLVTWLNNVLMQPENLVG